MFLRRRSLTIESKITISSSSYASGDRTCDCMVLSGLQFALVIFECKSSIGNSDFVQGLIHVVSHGLALRHKKQVAHEMKLVLLTPLYWYSASLPPYKDGASLNVSFEQFGVFFVEDNADETETLYLHRKEHLDFLKKLRQHFQLSNFNNSVFFYFQL